MSNTNTKKPDTKKADANRPKSKKRRRRRIILTVILILMAAAIGALSFAAYYVKQYTEFTQAYQDRFFEGTKINGIDVAGMTVDEVEAHLADSIGEYTLNLTFRNGQTETITGEDINYHYVSDGSVADLFRQQDMRSWFREYMKNGKTAPEVNAEAKVDTEYNETMLMDAIRALPELQDENMTEPQDCYMDFEDTKYVVVPEKEGTVLDKTLVQNTILDAVKELKPEVDVTAIENAYTKPARTMENAGAELQKEADMLNQYTSASITYNLPCGVVQTLNGQTTKNWLSTDAEGRYFKDEALWDQHIRSYVQEMADSVYSVGKTRIFHATGIGDVSVPGGNYGYEMDVETEIQQLTEELNNGTVTTREPNYISRETTDENNGFGDTYVEIDCTRQHLWIYVNGDVVLQTDVVTGQLTPSYSRATPVGTCLVYNKAVDYTLIGPGYRTPVNYWMPFNGSVGMHDAVWRGAFGGDIYLYDGSHGCVNMPYEAAAAAFDIVTFDMPIVVYYS